MIDSCSVFNAFYFMCLDCISPSILVKYHYTLPLLRKGFFMNISTMSTEELRHFVQRMMAIDGFAPTSDFTAAMKELQQRNA